MTLLLKPFLLNREIYQSKWFFILFSEIVQKRSPRTHMTPNDLFFIFKMASLIVRKQEEQRRNKIRRRRMENRIVRLSQEMLLNYEKIEDEKSVVISESVNSYAEVPLPLLPQ